ncbi:GspH/FimT family pseudopilin [Thiobaca trueperi]|nr:GspH/FimT family pseudopilin [Thiobaca trueperi]
MTASRIHQTRKVPAIRAMQPPARPWQAQHMAGVTLVELVITLSIAAILMTIAVPSFQDLMRTNRTATQVNEFLTALNLARSEAVKRGASVSVCSSTNSTACRTANTTNWADGWILYVTGSSPLEILRVWPALSGTATFTASTGQVTFRGTGQAAAAITFTYTPTGCSGDQRRTIAVSAVGRATSSKATCP